MDPIALEITCNGLKSIADEGLLTIMRSAFSTNIKERHDPSTAIAGAQGRLIAQAESALPIHLASISGLVRHILDQFRDSIAPGAIFIGNDPHVAGGTHLPGINLATPIFEGERLIGLVANIVRHADVGGAAVGSMSGRLDEIYKEGLRIPLSPAVPTGRACGRCLASADARHAPARKTAGRPERPDRGGPAGAAAEGDDRLHRGRSDRPDL